LREQSSGRLAGTLLLDEGIEPAGLELSLAVYLRREEQPILPHLPLDLRSDGSFESPGLPGGWANLAVGIRDGPTLAGIEGLTIPAGGFCNDPRLQEIDLRGRVHRFELSIFDHTGEPAWGAQLDWRASAPEGEERPYRHWVLTDQEGRAELLTDAAMIDLLVFARGACDEEVFGVARSREIHLREGLPLRFDLPEGVDPEGDEVTLALVLRPVDSNPRVGGSVGYALPARGRAKALFVGGSAEAIVPHAGRYTLEWRGWRGSGAQPEPLDLGGERREIVVHETSWCAPLLPDFPLERYRACVEGEATGGE